MPPPTIVELRPDRRFMDINFEGYKLNLNPLPHWVRTLSTPVDRVYPDEVQYSFVHAKLFALHNHLVPDLWDHGFTFYYVDSKQQVRRIAFDSDSHVIEEKVVYDIPAHVQRAPGHFNLSVSFPNATNAFISDGTGYLHVAITGIRGYNSDGAWKTLLSDLVLDGKYFVIVDSRAQPKDEKIVLNALLLSVDHDESHFFSVLTWVTYEEDNDVWKQTSFRQLSGKGVVHYAAIETSFEGVYISSDNPFKFIVDSVKEIEEDPKPTEPVKVIYTWLQTMDDVTITIKLPENYQKSLFHVNVEPMFVKISYAGTPFIEGKLFDHVDTELTTWDIEPEGNVDILLTKTDSRMWEEFIEGGDPSGEQIMDPSLVEDAHRKLAHLCSETELAVEAPPPAVAMQELEECDAGSEDTILARYDINLHKTTHRTPLSVHQILFHLPLHVGDAPAVALRHEVDACVWQPYPKLLVRDSWPLKHVGTLKAFGYIQSSKQNKKFVTCAPDCSYSVVCESSRHILIYRDKGSPETTLRHRNGGNSRNVSLGQQNVLNTDKYGEILGIYAANNYLFLLAKNTFIAIELM
ncbi:unnamed protein product [Plutella xylostella]|uniref:NudC domain-containing protein 1 n=1 Tax=Plutella xylostella TaxID=51655 RepID=A0A8S4F007_PLUXY|nr:unnamed protein product [Plutella xylostella]